MKQIKFKSESGDVVTLEGNIEIFVNPTFVDIHIDIDEKNTKYHLLSLCNDNHLDAFFSAEVNRVSIYTSVESILKINF